MSHWWKQACESDECYEKRSYRPNQTADRIHKCHRSHWSKFFLTNIWIFLKFQDRNAKEKTGSVKKPEIRFWKGSSQPYNLISLTPKRASFVKLILSSFSFICCWLKSRVFRPMRMFSGIKKQTINPNPASVEIPSSCHKKYIAIPIWNGEDHKTFMKAFQSQLPSTAKRILHKLDSLSVVERLDLRLSHETINGLAVNWHQIHHTTDWTVSFRFCVLIFL